MRRRIIRTALAALGVLALAGIVTAQVSPNFDLHWSLLDSGGGTRQSANAQLQDSLGQWTGGSTSSANFRVDGGFWPWAALPSRDKTYLPLIFKAT